MASQGMVLHCMASHGMVWHGLVWFASKRQPPVGLVAVGALALHGVEDKPTRARDGVRMAVHAEVELVTDRVVGMSEVTVLPRTPLVDRRLGGPLESLSKLQLA